MAPNEFVIRPLKNASSLLEDELWYQSHPVWRASLERITWSSPTSHKGKRSVRRNSDMDIPAGVVQYPKPEDAVPWEGQLFLMSFDNLDERADLQATRSFWICYRRKFSTWWWSVVEIFGKERAKNSWRIFSRRWSVKATSMLRLPRLDSHLRHRRILMASKRWSHCITYDYDMIMSDGLQSNGMPWFDYSGIHEINTEGTVKVIYPLNAVWSTNKGFKDFNQRLASSRQEGFERRLFIWHRATRPILTTPFWNRARRRRKDAGTEDNLSLDD
jgi:hypothetical protein